MVNAPGLGDDVDHGDLVFYTEHGGRDPGSRRQVRNQEFSSRNRTLLRNQETGQPVRLHRRHLQL